MTDRSLHLNDCPLSNAEIEHVLNVYDLKYHPSLQDRLKVSRNTIYRFVLLTRQYHVLIINRTHTTIFYNVDRYIRRVKQGLPPLTGKRGGQWKLQPEIEKQLGEATRCHNIKSFDGMVEEIQMIQSERHGCYYRKESKRTSQR